MKSVVVVEEFKTQAKKDHVNKEMSRNWISLPSQDASYLTYLKEDRQVLFYYCIITTLIIISSDTHFVFVKLNNISLLFVCASFTVSTEGEMSSCPALQESNQMMASEPGDLQFKCACDWQSRRDELDSSSVVSVTNTLTSANGFLEVMTCHHITFLFCVCSLIHIQHLDTYGLFVPMFIQEHAVSLRAGFIAFTFTFCNTFTQNPLKLLFPPRPQLHFFLGTEILYAAYLSTNCFRLTEQLVARASKKQHEHKTKSF